MATFHRQKKALKRTTVRRTFANTAKKAAKSARKTTNPSKITKRAAVTKSKIDRQIRKTTTTVQPTHSKRTKDLEKETSIDEITRYIKTASKNISAHHQARAENSTDTSPIAFNGLSSDQERFEFLESKLQEEQRRANKLQHQLALVKAEFDTEKETLEKEMKSLKKELHRTSPLTDNKFFSLSKELRGAVSAIEEVASNTNLDINIPQQAIQTPTNEPSLPVLHQITSPEASTPKVIAKPTLTTSEKKTAATPEKIDTDATAPAKIKPPANKKKVVTTIAATAILLLVSTGASVGLFSKPQVDQGLVDQYMKEQAEQTGIVAGTSETPDTSGNNQALENISDEDRINSPVLFEDTIWERFKDPIFGLQFQYPANASKVIKTDSSATFSRKQGYIFKIQRIETGLDLEEYWKQVQGTSLDYLSTKTQLANHDALALTLNEASDIPGNKYLIKAENVIYEIWYATDSEAFSNDDIQRADYMLSTISLIGQ